MKLLTTLLFLLIPTLGFSDKIIIEPKDFYLERQDKILKLSFIRSIDYFNKCSILSGSNVKDYSLRINKNLLKVTSIILEPIRSNFYRITFSTEQCNINYKTLLKCNPRIEVNISN